MIENNRSILCSEIFALSTKNSEYDLVIRIVANELLVFSCWIVNIKKNIQQLFIGYSLRVKSNLEFSIQFNLYKNEREQQILIVYLYNFSMAGVSSANFFIIRIFFMTACITRHDFFDA